MAHIAVASPPFSEALAVTNLTQSSILAEWGLQYCLQYDKENLFNPIEENNLFQLRKDVAQGRLDLQQYFDKHHKYLPNTTATHRFKVCMIIYKLEKYNLEIKRIVKKYCKDCE
ncbi:hypothetical protein [Campylobacter troglodytis]|uniref:hypothetical protein n=1 Tax=Campylobacter troglodytis TaxID=654363 RepID=UPI00115C4340|nr:hypothetical protein [Campylobacter troglodytis]TQR50857.1 hypothetical protein DMC01_12750 [Campylobacter troglodytis]